METQHNLGKIIRTSSGKVFAYDGRTAKIITVKDAWISQKAVSEDEEILEALLEEGYLTSGSFPGAVWHSDYETYKSRLESSLSWLVLQTTRQCNLDCSYCVYSGNYRHMLPHAKEHMTEETMMQGIDFYARHSRSGERARIAFYGGESLLRFEQIKKAVAYAKKVISGKELRFVVSTNGVLLREDVARWLVEYPEVSVAVTVNGPGHDVFRRDRSGRGSLERIMKNLERIRNGFPSVWENQVSFLANAASEAELGSILQFYREKLGRPPSEIIPIQSDMGNEAIRKTLEDSRKSSGQGSAGGKEALWRAYAEEEDPYPGAVFKGGLKTIHNRDIFEPGEPAYVSSCLALTSKLFVRTDGEFNICERISDSLSLGNLRDGYRRDRLEALYSGMRERVEKQCMDCWAQRLCMLCYEEMIDENGNFRREIRSEWCGYMKEYIENNLIRYCEIAARDTGRLKRL